MDEIVSTVLNDSDNAVDPGRLPSGMRSFLSHVHICILKYCAEADYGSGVSSLKPVS